MTIIEFKNALAQNPKGKLRFVLPDRSVIPGHFHITEVGHVRKDFIDCGGTRRSTVSCVLQAWVAENDEDHSLEAGKLARILELAGDLLPDGTLPVEVEFEAPTISQFPVDSVELTDDALHFYLSTKHTDCMAKEACGLTRDSCCAPASGCCG
jgi:hypothetical protein